MKKLDKYILTKFLSTFFFCLILLTVIVVVVDVSEHTDDFVKSKLPIWRIITDYYFGFIPRIDAMLFPAILSKITIFPSFLSGISPGISIILSGISLIFS